MKLKLMLLAFSMATIGCNKSNEVKIETTKLTGTITNPVGNIVNLKFGKTHLVDTLNEQGSFEFEFVLEKPTNITFQHGEYAYLYLNPQDSLNMTLDTNEFDQTLKFSGDSENQNQYLVAKILASYEGIPNETLYSKNETEFLTSVDSTMQASNRLLESHVEEDADARFYVIQKKANYFESLIKKIRYEGYYQRYTGDTTLKVSDNYYAFYNDLDKNNEELLSNRSYRNVLTEYIESKSSINEFDFSSESWSSLLQELVKIIDEEITNTQVKLRLYNNYVPQFLTKIEPEYAEKLLDKIKTLDTEDNYISDLEKQWTSLKKVAAGQPAPDLTFVDTQGNSVALASLKGKMVYIDVWATWCGPCMRELPHLEKLQEDLKNEKIVFMSVSIDDTQDPWKKMVEKKNMKGIQVYDPGAWNSSIIENFVIKGIPRFILLDKEGKIVDNDADRPSGNIKEVIIEKLKG